MNTLSFDAFWTWLQGHGNCIIRIATAESVIYDDEDLHWWIGIENGLHVAQVVRGKRLRGEVIIDPDRVSYVQIVGEQQEGEFSFELISESETERIAAFHFAMTHGLDEGEEGETHGLPVH